MPTSVGGSTLLTTGISAPAQIQYRTKRSEQLWLRALASANASPPKTLFVWQNINFDAVGIGGLGAESER